MNVRITKVLNTWYVEDNTGVLGEFSSKEAAEDFIRRIERILLTH